MNNTINLALALILGFIVGYMFVGKSSSPASGSTADVSGYSTENLADGLVKAIKNNDSGVKIEEGTLLNGKKSGPWLEFHPKDGRLKSFTSYADGLKNGMHMTLTDRGQVTLESYYKEDQLHGRQVKYKFGSRIEEESEYNMGVLNGVFKSYNSTGKLQREIHYKDGQLHGKNAFYDEEGNMTMEYQYEDGEKVGGGIIEKSGE